MLPFLQPAIHIDADQSIHITNVAPGRRTVFLCVTAALIFAPVVRPLFPADAYFAYEHSYAGLSVWMFGIFACASAAFSWSAVDIDCKSDTVTIRQRWGLFQSRFCTALSSYNAISLRKNDDDMCIYLDGPQRPRGLEFNYSRALVWGRDDDESASLADLIAKLLKLPLNIDQPQPVRVQLHV